MLVAPFLDAYSISLPVLFLDEMRLFLETDPGYLDLDWFLDA